VFALGGEKSSPHAFRSRAFVINVVGECEGFFFHFPEQALGSFVFALGQM
jgi:hypothetical protein